MVGARFSECPEAIHSTLPKCADEWNLSHARIPENIHEALKKDWNYVGEVNQLWAFNRRNQVICVTPGGGLPFQPAMMLLAGAKTEADLHAIEKSLSVSLSG